MNPHLHGQLIHDKRGKNIQKTKGSLFNKQDWENWTVDSKRIKLAYFLTTYNKLKKD